MVCPQIGDNAEAFLFAKLAVIIPTGLFVLGAISVGIWRYNTFLAYQKTKQAEKGVQWKDYKIDRNDDKTNTIRWYLTGWFAACFVCAIVLCIVGIVTVPDQKFQLL